MFTAGWLVCEDPGCTGRTRVMPLQFQRACPMCGVCRVSAMYQEYPAANLYTQILYMFNLVDKTKMINDDVLQTKLKAYNNGNAEQQYDGLKQLVERKFSGCNILPCLVNLFTPLFMALTKIHFGRNT